MMSETVGLGRAHALLMANRPADALAELSMLSTGEATSPVASLLRATALNQLDRYPEAVHAARAGLEAAGPEPGLLGQLSIALRNLGDRPGAERAILDALALAPTDVDLLCAYARLCAEVGQLDKATKLVERAMAESPEAAVVYATRAHIALAAGRDAEAQRISRAFVAAYPENPVAHALLGGASAARGQVGQGYASLRQASAAVPGEYDLAEATMEAKIAAHPLMWPIRPVLRFGPIKLWLTVLAVIFGLRAIGLTPLAGLLGLAWFGFCVYSWTVPPIVRRITLNRWRRAFPR